MTVNVSSVIASGQILMAVQIGGHTRRRLLQRHRTACREPQTAAQTTSNINTWNGAALSSLGIVNYDGLQYDDVTALTYTTTPITANAEGTNFLPDGAVFAVRTQSGNRSRSRC